MVRGIRVFYVLPNPLGCGRGRRYGMLFWFPCRLRSICCRCCGRVPRLFCRGMVHAVEGVCHCHLICFEQDVVWQPQMHIEEELFMKVVLIFYLVEVRFGYVLVAHLALICRREYFICFFVVHDECLTDVGIFYGSCISLEEVKSSLVWLVFCPVSEFFYG